MNTTQTVADEKGYEFVQDLHVRALDANEGYAKAADLTKSEGLKNFFGENSEQRAQFALELEGLLRKANIEPRDSGTLAGKVHQGWMALVSKVGDCEKNLLNECQRGEESALGEYQEALDSMELSPEISAVVERQKDRLKAEIVSLKEIGKIASATGVQ